MRALKNVHPAMDYLAQQNRLNAGREVAPDEQISARDRIVVVIGGGDTGSDCVGTAIRQGAKEVHQFEILPKPPDARAAETLWPLWPNVLRTSTSHEEGCRRRWGVLTRRLGGVGTRASELHGAEVDWTPASGGMKMTERPGTEFTIKVDLVLLATGFVHVTHRGVIEKLELELDPRGNLKGDADFQTTRPGVFAAGDTVDGASLVVRAIHGGRRAAEAIDRRLREK